MRNKFKVDHIALRPADHSIGFTSVSGEQVIAAIDAQILAGTRAWCLELRKVK